MGEAKEFRWRSCSSVEGTFIYLTELRITQLVYKYLSSVTTAIRPAFLSYVTPIFERCMTLVPSIPAEPQPRQSGQTFLRRRPRPAFRTLLGLGMALENPA